MITATGTIRPSARTLTYGGVEPEVGPVALQRAGQERLDAGVDVLAETRDLALGDAAHAHGLDQVVDRAGRDALDVGFLDDRGERLLGCTAGLQEGRKVAAGAELRNAEIHRAGTGLPGALAVAVALVGAGRGALAVGRTRAALDLELHQPLGRVADHAAEKFGVGALGEQALQGHHGIGHRGPSGAGCYVSNFNPTRRSRWPPAAGPPPPAPWRRGGSPAGRPFLHHALGHNQTPVLNTAKQTVERFHEIWEKEQNNLPQRKQVTERIDAHLKTLRI